MPLRAGAEVWHIVRAVDAFISRLVRFQTCDLALCTHSISQEQDAPSNNGHRY